MTELMAAIAAGVALAEEAIELAEDVADISATVKEEFSDIWETLFG